MKKILFFIALLATLSVNAQTWTDIFGRQRFRNGVGLPVKTLSSVSGADSAQGWIDPVDSLFKWAYKGLVQKSASFGSRAQWDSAYNRRLTSLAFSGGTLTSILGSSQRLDVSLDGRYNKISDTAAMLSSYARFQAVLKYYDSAAMLSNRLKISDTANMLLPFVRTYGAQTINGAKTLTSILTGTTAEFSTPAGSPFKIFGSSSSGLSAGLYIDAGTTTLDFPLRIRNQPGTVDYLSVNGAGKVGIGTVAPVWMLEINKSTSAGGLGDYPTLSINNANASGFSAMYFFQGTTNKGGLEMNNSAGTLSILTTATAITISNAQLLRFNAYGAGTLVTDASGNVTATSDKRKKDFIGNYNRGLGAIMQLNPVLYHWNKSSGFSTVETNAYFFAQDVEKVIPEAVFYDSKKDNYTMTDRALIATMVNAIQELNQQITELKKKKNENINSITTNQR